MNKKILSLLAISFCAGCGLFADEPAEAPAIEVIAPEDTAVNCVSYLEAHQVEDKIACCGRGKKKPLAEEPTNEPVASCCGKHKKPAQAEEPVACCGTCEEEVQAEEEAIAGCGCKRPKDKDDVACSCGCGKPVSIACCCGCDNCPEANDSEDAEVSNDAVACCGTCDDEAQVQDDAFAGCGCGKDDLVAAA